jgi:hypothetical protein
MPDPNPAQTLVKLAVKFIEYQGKRLIGEGFANEVLKTLAEYAGEDATARLTGFFSDHTEKILAAFRAADDCFAGKSDLYAQLIRSKPFANLESLNQLAATLPDQLDHARVIDALHRQFLQDWQGQLSDAQATAAANIYTDCLIRAFAIKFEQELPLLIRIVEKLDHLIITTDETLERVKRIETQVTGGVWRRPPTPRADPGFVGRRKELDEVRALLMPGTRTAITATVHGASGIGKTFLARQLAAELDAHFPGGVIFQKLGSRHRRDDCTPILDAWARNTGFPLGRDDHISPDALRGWLAGNGALLIVLDDVWERAAIQPLLDAAPADASLLITTRKPRLAQEMCGAVYPLDILMPNDALALLRARMPRATKADTSLLEQLASALEYHTQALDIAGRQLHRWEKSRWQAKVAELAQRVREGEAFGELPFPGEETRVSEVEAALKWSYDELAPRAQARFRLLGAFAPEASFRAEFAAMLWECSADEAFGTLTDFAERGLVNEEQATQVAATNTSRPAATRAPRWQQHILLRAYALALLRRAGEEDAAHRHHAEIFSSAMRKADDEQRYYEMRPEYPQLRHAFEWAIDVETGRRHVSAFEMAQDIAANAANLQAQFGLVRESDDWSRRLLERAREGKEEQMLARALVTRSNALSRVATLPNEDRAARLRAALAAYDEALRFYTPDTAPLDYAMTQNNRGTVLCDLATLPDEDRAARLRAALAAYDEALRFRRPDTAPLNYATTQNNRGNVLSDLATLPDEDRAALAAYDEALRFRRPDTAPLDYAATQNNRGAVLQTLATLPDEDRAARLRDALAACDEALRFWTPDTAPLAYAAAQMGRGIVLRALATLPDEDRAARLREALAAYDEALRFWTPATAPLDYAATQNNRGTVLQDLATLPDEDRAARLRAALAAYDEALRFRRPDTAPLDYAATQNNRGLLLQDLATLSDEDRAARLREALAAYDEALRFRRPDTAPLAYAMTQFNLALLKMALAELPGEDRRARCKQALQHIVTALSIFSQQQHAQYAQRAAGVLRWIAEECGEQ